MTSHQSYFCSPHGTLYQGDALDVLASLSDESVQCCVTSPPYWGLRDYGVHGQIGLEITPQAHIERLVSVFREVRRVLKKDGTLWLNYADTYAGSGKGRNADGRPGKRESPLQASHAGPAQGCIMPRHIKGDRPAKSLLGLPWRLAFALQDEGWLLRSDIIWHKPNAMPERCQDRPTRAHEYLFLFSKSAHYFYDAEAIQEPVAACDPLSMNSRLQNVESLSFARKVKEPDRPGHTQMQHRLQRKKGKPSENRAAFRGGGKYTQGQSFENCEGVENTVKGNVENTTLTRNKRTVWTIPTFPCSDAHFATFPPALAETCIRAGTRLGDTVLDPFLGSGTTGMVARKMSRKWIGVELNEDYCSLALKRIDVGRLMLTEIV